MARLTQADILLHLRYDPASARARLRHENDQTEQARRITEALRKESREHKSNGRQERVSLSPRSHNSSEKG